MAMFEANEKKILETLGDIEITEAELNTIKWLSEGPVDTVDRICNLIIKAKSQFNTNVKK